MAIGVLDDSIMAQIDQEYKDYYASLRRSGVDSKTAYSLAMQRRQELITMATQKYQADQSEGPSSSNILAMALGGAAAGGAGLALGQNLIGSKGEPSWIGQGIDWIGNQFVPSAPTAPSVTPTASAPTNPEMFAPASPKAPQPASFGDGPMGVGGPDPIPTGVMNINGMEFSGISPEGFPLSPEMMAEGGFISDAQSAAAWPVDEALSGWDISGEAGAAAEAPGMLGGYVLPGASAVLGGWQGYEGIKNGNPLQAGLGGAGLGIGGTALLSNLGVIGAVNPLAAGLIGAAVLGGGALFGGHKSTKQYQAERQQALRDKNITGYAEFMDQIDPSKDPNYGKVPDFNNLKAEDVWGSEGVFSTFGNDWLGKYTEDQRRRIAQRLLEEGLFQGDHGDVIIHSDNQERARQIANEELTGPAAATEQVSQTGGLSLDPNNSPLTKSTGFDGQSDWLKSLLESLGSDGTGSGATGSLAPSTLAQALAQYTRPATLSPQQGFYLK